MSIRNQIIQGDCIAVLRTIQDRSVDLVVTDPPYLVGYRDRTGRSIAGDDSPETVLPSYTAS